MTWVSVNFYALSQYEPKNRLERIGLALHRLFLGDSFIHCLVIDNQRRIAYECSRAGGCEILPRYKVLALPAAKLLVRVPELNTIDFDEGRPFHVKRTLLDMLRVPRCLLGKNYTNCVQATARLLGIRERMRTPIELHEYLNRGKRR